MFEKSQISNFMKIRLVGAELFHVDKETHRWIERQTHMTKLIVAFHNFSNSPNKVPKSYTVWKKYSRKFKGHTMKAYGEMKTHLHFY